MHKTILFSKLCYNKLSLTCSSDKHQSESEVLNLTSQSRITPVNESVYYQEDVDKIKSEHEQG